MNKKLIVTTIILISAALIPLSLGEQTNTVTDLKNENSSADFSIGINCKENGYVNTPIDFQAEVQGGQGPYEFEWDFGDGSEALLIPNPIHSFSEIGTYTVTLTVTDSTMYDEKEATTTTNITIEDEQNDPEVTITKPESAVYVNNNKVMSSRNTFIIGDITVKATAIDDESGIKNVTFSIDGNVKGEVFIDPFQWTWNTGTFGRHTITATAYDHTGNSASDVIDVYKLF